MKNRGKFARVLTTATVASNEFLKIYVTPEELIKQWCLRGSLSDKNRAGDFLFRVKFITGAALEHLFRTTKTPRAYIFSEKGDCFIFYEKICWESLFSELYSAYLLIECNLGERGESWRGREDIFISGHQESKGVVGRARWTKEIQCGENQPPPRADLGTGTGHRSESSSSLHDTISKRRWEI